MQEEQQQQQQKQQPSSLSRREQPPASALLTPAEDAPDPTGGDDDDDSANLARFEFSDEGTKILMVEWSPGAVVASASSSSSSAAAAARSKPVSAPDLAPDNASWEVSWPGKSTVLPAREVDQQSARRRVYFLLPHEAAVPPTVTVSRSGGAAPVSLDLKPLPAIFPEGLLGAEAAGRRGVLHTIWARRRLAELQREMDAEMRANAEGVGLQMAVAERDWIEHNFLRPLPPPPVASPEVSSARSLFSGSLGDKLRGLRLATSPQDLAASPTANTFTGAYPMVHHGDVAISSFSESSVGQPATGAGEPTIPKSRAAVDEDDLFAKPMSPRSPEMKKSPFSALV